MKKIIFLALICFLLISCKEKKIEFVESKVIKGFFVVKNPPKEDFLLQKQLVNFVLKILKSQMIHQFIFIQTIQTRNIF